MPILSNPFHEQFVTETIAPREFVDLFSSTLLPQTRSLFMPGNVVLKGVRGSGKSMLLSLLKPSVRVAYARASQTFPLEGALGNFFSAGINLTRSGFGMFGQRTLTATQGDVGKQILALCAADFFNYWVVLDILDGIVYLSDEQRKSPGVAFPTINPDRSLWNEFALKLAHDDCWFGHLEGIRDWSSLQEAIRKRITSYRAYFNFNRDEIGDAITNTKTTIGDPISATVDLLRSTEICAQDTEFLIRIDQYEELFYLDGTLRHLGLQDIFRGRIDKALATRDPRVSYRIGTRGYAWRAGVDQSWTSVKLEEGRDYKLIDLDDILRRNENTSGWVFPRFADDVFSRRLRHTQVAVKNTAVADIMGKGLTQTEKAIKYAGTRPHRAIVFETTWPEKWKSFLRTLALSDPLSARFGEAWARQRGKSTIVNNVPLAPFPWDSKSTDVWRRERYQHALMQIAGACSQRVTYSGHADIIGVSGSNISVFLTICGQIWNSWLASLRHELGSVTPESVIPTENQSVGILEASTRYYDNISQDGKHLQLLVSFIGTTLNYKLYNDRPLSYPGHNGFSLRLEDYQNNDKVRAVLDQLTDLGHLLDSAHTTKEKDRRPRKKWYLSPILAPMFDLPYIRKKEPWYIHSADVEEWIDKSYSGETPQKPSISRELLLPFV